MLDPYLTTHSSKIDIAMRRPSQSEIFSSPTWNLWEHAIAN